MDKATKKLLTEQQKRMRPGECLKYITTLIEPTILTDDPLSAQIQSVLKENGIAAKTTAAAGLYRSITWQRSTSPTTAAIFTASKSKNPSSIGSDAVTEEDHILLVWTAAAICDSIVNTPGDLIAQLSTQQRLASAGGRQRRITLIVGGLGEHLRITQPQSHKRAAQRQRVDRELTRLQLHTGIAHRCVGTAAELANTVLLFTKSVAEQPYKQQQAQGMSEQCFYVANDNRDCVAVRGNVGLANLWQHQLCKLPMATLETAEAIIGEYAMPRLLLEAYASCDGDGANLLANIPVRRAGGPLSTVRKIGPELSRRVYELFTNDNPDMIL